VRIIRDTGRVPVERDGLYRTVHRYDQDTFAEPAGMGRGASGTARDAVGPRAQGAGQ